MKTELLVDPFSSLSGAALVAKSGIAGSHPGRWFKSSLARFHSKNNGSVAEWLMQIGENEAASRDSGNASNARGTNSEILTPGLGGSIPPASTLSQNRNKLLTTSPEGVLSRCSDSQLSHATTCQIDVLDSTVQPPHGCLNTCLTCSKHGGGHRGFVPRRLNCCSGDFPNTSLNRVTTGNRVRRVAGEGMARGVSIALPRLMRRVSSLYLANARIRCNSGRRDKPRVGQAKPLPETVQNREANDRRLCCLAKRTTSQNQSGGWFAARSLPLALLSRKSAFPIPDSKRYSTVASIGLN